MSSTFSSHNFSFLLLFPLSNKSALCLSLSLSLRLSVQSGILPPLPSPPAPHSPSLLDPRRVAAATPCLPPPAPPLSPPLAPPLSPPLDPNTRSWPTFRGPSSQEQFPPPRAPPPTHLRLTLPRRLSFPRILRPLHLQTHTVLHLKRL